MFASFRSRLVLSNLLITLIGLMLVVAVSTYVLAKRNQESNKNRLAHESRSVATEIDRLFAVHGGSIWPTVHTAANILGEHIVVVGLHKTIVADSEESVARVTPVGQGIVQHLDSQALAAQRSALSRMQDPNHFVFQSPIHGTGDRGIVGAVLLVAYVNDVQPAIGPLIAVALAIAVLIWLLVGLYFTVSISRPLLRITAATRAMAGGNYGVRVPGRGQGELSRLATSFNDMAERVEQSNRVLKDFVANVSHDLRTPLTMIAGFSQALLDGTAREEEVESSATVIHEEAQKMERLVDDLLQLTKLESGLLKLQCHPTALRPFVQTLIDRIQRSRTDRPIPALINRVPRNLPMVQIDSGQLERALRNLVDNALQYTPSGGTVTVGAVSIGRGWVEIQVTDTGSGIAGQDVERVFERFYRSDRSRERQHGHSGLGLAIVREIIEAHGGRVRVESEEQKGATFRFTVPQARQPEIGPEIAAVHTAPPRAVTQE